ncbi:MAG: transposase, partial [Candidatus Bathyarchaeia archaeon]
IKDSSKLRRVSKAVMDGAYDNAEAYNLLRRMSVKPIIKPRRNARADGGPSERRRAVRIIKRVGDEGWARTVGYGKRWAVETAFSTFKRQYGEYCMAKWKA